MGETANAKSFERCCTKSVPEIIILRGDNKNKPSRKNIDEYKIKQGYKIRKKSEKQQIKISFKY